MQSVPPPALPMSSQPTTCSCPVVSFPEQALIAAQCTWSVLQEKDTWLRYGWGAATSCQHRLRFTPHAGQAATLGSNIAEIICTVDGTFHQCQQL